MVNALNIHNRPKITVIITYYSTHPYWYIEKDPQVNLVTGLVYITYLILKIRPILYNFSIDLLTYTVWL